MYLEQEAVNALEPMHDCAHRTYIHRSCCMHSRSQVIFRQRSDLDNGASGNLLIAGNVDTRLPNTVWNSPYAVDTSCKQWREALGHEATKA